MHIRVNTEVFNIRAYINTNLIFYISIVNNNYNSLDSNSKKGNHVNNRLCLSLQGNDTRGGKRAGK